VTDEPGRTPGPTTTDPTAPGPTIPGPTTPGPSTPGPTTPGPTIPGPSTATLSIVAGSPTPEEAAAVTVVLTAVMGAATAATQPGGDGHRSAWSDRSRLLRPAVSAGPGAWRGSALPG
jgi:hypothetical protein